MLEKRGFKNKQTNKQQQQQKLTQPHRPGFVFKPFTDECAVFARPTVNTGKVITL